MEKSQINSNLMPYPLRFMSKGQRKKLERDSQICQEFLQLRQQFPKLSRRRIIDSLVQKTACSFSCIYQILNRANIW